MTYKNTNEQFGWVAITFHWVVAILVFFQLGVGLYMADLPVSLKKLKLFGLHKEFGLLILFLVVLRFVWRMANTQPTYPLDMPPWQVTASRSVHIALYACLFLMPLTGWMISSGGIAYFIFWLIFNANLNFS